MADPNPNPRPEDLFDPEQLDPEMLQLLGDGVSRVVAAAATGSRHQLHATERAWAAAALAALDVRLELVGLERADPGCSYIVAPLHEGFVDVLALLHLPLDLSWVIRDELLSLPYFGDYLRSAGHIAVSPENPREAMRRILSVVPSRLGDRESVVIFPQGSLLGIEIAFQPGAFQLADRCGVPVLPVVLTGSHTVWDYPFDRTLHPGRTVRMEVLHPLAPGSAVASMRILELEMKRRALAIKAAPARRYVRERDGAWEGYRFEVDPEFIGR